MHTHVYMHTCVYMHVHIHTCTHRETWPVAQWIEHGPANQRVAGSNPSQGTGLGCRPGPQEGE